MLVKTFSIDQFVNDANDAILDALNDLMILCVRFSIKLKNIERNSHLISLTEKCVSSLHFQWNNK